jgi:bifunctional non-homologous end joining protein LigD
MPASKLARYQAKRDFRRTAEPFGRQTNDAGNMFMVHKHDATRLHYDLRLQFGDVLKSWAVPKGPSLDPSERRLAVEVEDHPLEYGDFEGVIAKGQYGAGPTLIWDRGTWAPMGDMEEGLRSGALKFRLAGEKLKGGWMLTRLKPRKGDKQPNWLLIKERDSDAAAGFDILDKRPESVLTGRRIEELTSEDPEPPKPRTLRPGSLKGAAKRELPKTLAPQLASLVARPPAGGEWLHEIKFDGYRTIAVIDSSTVRFLTRNGHDWTSRYGGLADPFSKLACKSAVIDGEVVVLDDKGVSRFGALQDALANGETWKLVFYAFDLPYLNGWDVSAAPLTKRKSLLESLLQSLTRPDSALQFSEHVVSNGEEFFAHVSELGLEGVVSKRLDSPYHEGRSKSWLKCKARQTGTFLIIGYTTSKAAGGLGALLLADRESGSLRYAGKVGTGFSAKEADALLAKLNARRRDKPACDVPGKHSATVWVEPVLEATVQYAERTRDNQLRQAAYQGVREPDPPAAGNAEPPRRYITDKHLASIWVTNPERHMFSTDGPTKLDLALYYASIGDFMLPHILERPVSLVRCPTGKAADCFFQRHAFSGMPAGIEKFVSEKEEGESREYLFVTDANGYLGLAQFGVVEFHPWGCRVDKPDRPDRMVFDLDPGEGVEWRHVVDAALLVRAELERLNLVPFVKTSGKKGIHITVPVKRIYSWDRLHSSSGKIAARIAKEFPSAFTTTMAKDRRKGRIFLDFHRNARSATSVAAYSLRAGVGLPASTPVRWADLESIDAPEDMNYFTVPGYVRVNGDPWGDIEASARPLGRIE